LSYNLQKYGRFPIDLALYFFKQMVGAIHHMNSRGFCHRDLKPWNIMLTKDLADLRVIDFSYSTPLKASDIEEHNGKLLGFLPGTKFFMAPE
jgi:serine/threonine protein kinase